MYALRRKEKGMCSFTGRPSILRKPPMENQLGLLKEGRLLEAVFSLRRRKRAENFAQPFSFGVAE
jgi:hypothetical protein